MAHTLQLTLGGSTIDLNASNTIYGSDTVTASILEYIPKSPNLSTIDTNTILVDGGRRTLTSRRNVTETARVNVSASTASGLQKMKHNIQEWMLRAENRQELQSGSRVYVKYAPDGLSGSVYQSELIGGKVELDEDSLDWRWTKARTVPMDIIWSRDYFWEGDETQITLDSGGTTSTCPTIYNHNQTNVSEYNWVHISASDVTGEIPTPTIVELYNDMNSDRTHNYSYLHHNVLADPENLWHVLEGEDSGLSGSTVTDTNYSGSQYMSASYTSETNWQTLFRWSLPSASLSKMRGNYFDILVAFAGGAPAASSFGQVVLRDSGLSVTFTYGPETELTKELQSFGVIRIPPHIATGDYTDMAAIELGLSFKRSAETGFDVDFVQLSPVDGTRYIKPITTTWSASLLVVDDGINNIVYESDEDLTNKFPAWVWRGTPIMLRPRQEQRIYYLASFSGAAGIVTSRTKVRVKYRPRRLTI